MKKQNADYSWLGWAIAVVLIGFFLISVFNDSDSNSSSQIAPEADTASEQVPTAEVTVMESQQSVNSWSCVDATSYNQNAYDDNRCTNGSETRYVSDSQAVALDPSYSPGKAGASYYNNR